MAYKLADRVRFLVTSTGTGAITVGAAFSGFRTPSGAGYATGDTAPYTIEGASGAWETGIFTVNSDGSLARTLRASSTGSLLGLTGNENAYVDPATADIALKSSTTAQDFATAPTVLGSAVAVTGTSFNAGAVLGLGAGVAANGETDLQWTTGGVVRSYISTSGTAGANWQLNHCDNSGAYASTSVIVPRATGVWAFSNYPTFSGYSAVSVAGGQTIGGQTNFGRVAATNDIICGRSTSAGALYFGNSASQYLYWDGSTFHLEGAAQGDLSVNGNVRPTSDGGYNSGGASNRWNTIYASTGTINTSDEDEKDIHGLITDDLLDAWASVEPLMFQFKASVDKKGADEARIHVGYSAQRVREAIDAKCGEGYAARLGLWCSDALTAPVMKTRTAKRAVMVPGPQVPQVVITDGKASVVMVDGPEVQKTDTHPLFDPESGEPVMIQPPAIPQPNDANGDPVDPIIPPPVQATITVSVTEDYKEIWQDGVAPTGKTREGLRMSHCAVLDGALAKREIARLKAEIAALKAA